MSKNVPSHEVLDRRLDALRVRVFRAQGIVGTMSRAAHAVSTFSLTEEEQQRFASDAWMALEQLHGLLEGIAGDLEPAVVLDAEKEPEAA